MDPMKIRVAERPLQIEDRHLEMLDELRAFWGCKRSEAMRSILRSALATKGLQ